MIVGLCDPRYPDCFSDLTGLRVLILQTNAIINKVYSNAFKTSTMNRILRIIAFGISKKTVIRPNNGKLQQ